MPRVAYALLLALGVLPFSAGAAGHDVSAVRYTSTGVVSRPVRTAGNGNRFLTIWSLDQAPRPTRAYSSVTETANGPSSLPFALPGVAGMPDAILPWGSGFISLWGNDDGFDIVTFLANGGVQRVSHVQRFAWPYRFATNGRQLLVVDKYETSNSSTVYASLYEPDGRLLSRTPLPSNFPTNFDVARAGNTYVVVTGGLYGDVHFFRLDDAGTIIAEKELQGVPPPYAMRQPVVAIAGDAEHAIVAWTPTETSAAYTASISSNNDVAVLQQLPIKSAYTAGISIVPIPSGDLILWTDNNAVSGVRTNATGQLIDDRAIPIASGYLESAAAGGDQFAVITTPPDGSSAPRSMTVGTVSAQGVRTFSSPLVMPAAARQERPVVASDGVDYVSAWLEHDGDSVIAKVGRVSRAGVPLDGPGITLPAPTKSVLNVSIARGAGGDALVVVTAAEGTWAFRWSRSVGLIDTAPIRLDYGTYSGSALAWNGVSYLVVWADAYSGGLAGRFVGSDGTTGAKFDIPMTLFKDERIYASYPAIAWDGRQFLISIPTAYEMPCSSLCLAPVPEEIRLVRLSAGGSPLDKTPYRLLKAFSTRVATSGSEFLVLAGNNDGFSAFVVHASQSGLSVSEPVLPTVPSLVFDVTWDGSYYDVPWQGAGDWLRLWRLDRSGSLTQKLFTPVSPSSFSSTLSRAPSVTANDAGEVAITISEDAPPSNLPRARIYFGAELESVQPVLTAPTNAVSHPLSPPYAIVTWDGNAPGFIIEKFYPPSSWFESQLLPGDVHQATVYAYVGDTIRIRAYGPDGSTPDGAITTIRNEPRTRTVRL